MYNVKSIVSSGRIINEDAFIDISHYDYIISSLSSNDLSRYFIISPELFFADTDLLAGMLDIENIIPPHVLSDLKDRKCKLIIDLSFEATGLATPYTDSVENGNNSHLIDVYSVINKFCDLHGIIDNTIFISMMEDADSYVNQHYADSNLHIRTCPSVPMRYRQFRYDDYVHLLNTHGPANNALWLNRRIRDHRVNLIAKCVDNAIDFNKFNFSFIGSRFEIYETISADHDMKSISNCKHVTDINFQEIISHYGKIVGLDDTNKSVDEMDRWLGTSSIGRVIEMLKIRSNSAYEIVSEFTHNDIGIHFSEKFTLPILSKKPFLISGDRGIMHKLKTMGFKTFEDFWSESYDDYHEHKSDTKVTRTEALANTIAHIEDNFHTDSNYTRDEYGNVIYCEKMQKILEHNYNHFINVYCPHLLNNWQSVFANQSTYTKLKGLHPCEVKEQVVKNETWEDAAWYHEATNHFFIPIWRNANTFFMNRIAENCGYRLVKNYDVADWQTVPAYAFIRRPDKRIAGQYWRANVNSGIEFNDLKETDDWSSLDMHLVPQHTFIEQYNIVHCVDLDNALNVHAITEVSEEVVRTINDVIHIMNTDQQERNMVDTNFKKETESVLSSDWFIKKHTSYYRNDYKLYFDKADWKFKNHVHLINQICPYLDSFFNTQDNIDMVSSIKTMVDEKHHEYVDSNLDDYWITHGQMLEAAGVTGAPKDSSILDFGTQFGFLPMMLERYGFTNVQSCNSMSESGGHEELEKVWDFININKPFDLTVRVNDEFTLPQKYDIIIIARTNMFWLMDDVFCYKGGEITTHWQVTDHEGKPNTFFSVYNKSQYEKFEENIKKFLNPGGFVIVQPEPFVYRQYPDKYHEELTWFEDRQQRGYTRITPNKHYRNAELQDYFIISNDKDYTE
tara:strand:- start:4529 stop:7240 length:2712 start_codon:yes stop_codon:yes gene_type:complete